MKKYKIVKPVLFFYKPRFSCVIGKLNENLVCYDVTDDVLEFEASPKWMLLDVNLLIKFSDLVIVSSEKLYQKILPSRKKDLFLIGNGVDLPHIKNINKNTLPRPADTNNIQSPILGYIGAIGEWFDFKILDLILEKYPHVSIVIIGWLFGKQKKEIQYLTKKYSNFHFLGRKTYEELPQYVKIFDACLIPFRVYSLTESVNPIKLYEYLASGKKVISTSLPELEKFKDIVYVAKNHDEFVSHIKIALNEKPDIEKLFKIARENDWNVNVAKMIDLIENRVSTIGKKV
jgi:glycosyltransferase involved in cell wall biosynthesis